MRKTIPFLLAALALTACTSASKREPAAILQSIQGDSPEQIVRMMKDWLKPGTHAGISQNSQNACVVHVLASGTNRFDIFVSETVDLRAQGNSGVAIVSEPDVLFHIFAAQEPSAVHVDRYNLAMSFHDSLDLRRIDENSISVRTQHLQEDVVQDSAICVLSK